MSGSKHIYRAYHMDDENKVCRVDIIDADDDDTAMEMLRQIPNIFGLELWDQERLIGNAAPRWHQ